MELAAFGAALSLYALLLWFLDRRFHRKLSTAFARDHCAGPDFNAVCETLEDLNEDCAHFVFTAERSGNVRFGEGQFTLVYGRVGSRSPGGIRGPSWRLRKTVYALVPGGQTEWIKGHPEVFAHAVSGYRYSIYWVKLDALLAG